MDFITWPPESVEYGGTYEAILVVVDKFYKIYHFIPCSSDMTVGELADVITQEVIRFYGVPSAIISDRRSLFTSWLQANLVYFFCIKRQFSTAFHPQTDGQKKKQHSVFEQHLRSYVNYQQDEWAPLLALAQFACNTAVHS